MNNSSAMSWTSNDSDLKQIHLVQYNYSEIILEPQWLTGLIFQSVNSIEEQQHIQRLCGVHTPFLFQLQPVNENEFFPKWLDWLNKMEKNRMKIRTSGYWMNIVPSPDFLPHKVDDFLACVCQMWKYCERFNAPVFVNRFAIQSIHETFNSIFRCGIWNSCRHWIECNHRRNRNDVTIVPVNHITNENPCCLQFVHILINKCSTRNIWSFKFYPKMWHNIDIHHPLNCTIITVAERISRH